MKLHYNVIKWLCLLFLLFFGLFDVEAKCPEKCQCKNNTDTVLNLRVKCGGGGTTIADTLFNWQSLEFDDEAVNVEILDLSKNGFSTIDKEYFRNITELKRLDLSGNMLKTIDKSTFGDVFVNLEKLRLANNSISHIFPGSFDHMPKLKQLDISSNPLACDCDLIWLVSWSNTRLVKLQPHPKCESEDFKGINLKKLKVGVDLFCESPLQPLLEFVPKQNQVVFEGDELILKCRAPRVAIGVHRESEDLPTRAHVFWGWSEKIHSQNSTDDIVYEDPTKVLHDVHLESKHTTDSGILDSVLRIPSVRRNHTGMFDCTLRSQQANLSHAIAVIVIAKNTQYCKAVHVNTNKGNYHWPQTIRGQTVVQDCVEEANGGQIATYHCDEQGNWVHINTKLCAYVSPTTRLLEQFAKMNLTLNKANVLEIARRVHNFTHTNANLRRIRDPIDLEFVARTLLKYLDFITFQNELAHLLLDIVSQLLTLPATTFYKAQEEHQSGLKLLTCVEAASRQTSLVSPGSEEQTFKEQLVSMPRSFFIDYFNIPESFSGMSCVWIRSTVSSMSSFECSTSNDSFPSFEQNIDAAIEVPANSLFDNKTSRFMVKLMVAVFRNANLLPHLTANKSVLLSSPIIGAKIIYEDSSHSQDVYYSSSDFEEKQQVAVILRVHPFHDDRSAPIPAWWDTEKKKWSPEYCQELYLHRGLLMFSCKRLGYYGLLQQSKYLNDFESMNAGARFRFLPYAIYVGTGVLFICLSINIVTFLVFGKAIRINRQQRHTFINTWLALAMLCLVFSFGIFQTERQDLCRILGMLMHYLSLCILLWLCVSLSTMYKRLSKHHRVVTESDLPKEVRMKKPIMGIYLVGWGIAMMICGISGAVNINEYAAYSFCFLHNASAMNAVLVPGGILFIFLFILFLTIYYQLNHRSAVASMMQNQNQFSDNTQATENIDMDWLDSNHCTQTRRLNTNTKSMNMDQYTSLTLSNTAASSIVDDFERTNLAHLRAHFVFLILYIIAWLSAVAFIMHFSQADHEKGQIYSIIFSVACCVLGIFTLLFYTLTRNDTRQQWRQNPCCGSDTSTGCCDEGPYDEGAAPMATNSVLAFKPSYDAANNSGASRSNSQCSKHRTGSIRNGNSNNDGTTQHLLSISTSSAAPPAIINNQHLVGGINIQHDIPSAELFYNPNQINVARKFFKKQKRLAKRNNFELQRQKDRHDYGGAVDNMSDGSSTTGSGNLYSRRHNAMTLKLLSSGVGKVNNTNINYKPDYSVSYKNNTALNMEAFEDEGGLFVPPNVVNCNAQDSNSLRKRSSILAMNIYTNIPETMAPQHEVHNMRGSNNNQTGVRSLKPLEEHHEEMEEMDNSSHNDNIPLYENTKRANVKPIASNFFNTSFSSNLALNFPATSTPNQTFLPSEPKEEKLHSLLLDLDDKEAMNCIGLPISNDPSNDTILDSDEGEDNQKPALERNEIYVSNSLQITDRVDVDDDFSSVLIRCSRPKHSKSLNNLDTIFETGASYTAKESDIDETDKTCVNYGSEKNIAMCASRYASFYKTCGNDKLTSTLPSSICEKISSPSNTQKFLADSCVSECDGNAAQNFQIAGTFTRSASPTNESDLNYQNSEISIRSHGLYAPQADNDLTLTDDFRYQSSNASENEISVNDFEDEFTVFAGHNFNNDLDSNDHEHAGESELNTSIDELYEAIKRRSPQVDKLSGVENFNDSLSNINKSASEDCESHNSKTDKNSGSTAMILHPEPSSGKLLSSYPASGIATVAKSFRENHIDDDSSQSSVISYIDPNVTRSKS